MHEVGCVDEVGGEEVAVRRPVSENAAMTNASARGATPAATVAAMVPGGHGRPFGRPEETDIAAHGDVVGEFLASGEGARLAMVDGRRRADEHSCGW